MMVRWFNNLITSVLIIHYNLLWGYVFDNIGIILDSLSEYIKYARLFCLNHDDSVRQPDRFADNFILPTLHTVLTASFLLYVREQGSYPGITPLHWLHLNCSHILSSIWLKEKKINYVPLSLFLSYLSPPLCSLILSPWDPAGGEASEWRRRPGGGRANTGTTTASNCVAVAWEKKRKSWVWVLK